MGMANREGSIYFSGFLIIGVFFLVKTAAALGEEGFFKHALFRKPVSKRQKRTPVFNFVAGNAIQIGVPENFS